MCPHDKLSNFSWPPAAVCWATLTSSQHQPHTSTSIYNEADSAEVVDPIDTAQLNIGTAAGQVAHSTERAFIRSIAKTFDAAVLGMQPGFGAILSSKNGCQYEKEVGTSFSFVKINHMRDWDKLELWAFNGKALMLLAWPSWAMLTILRSRISFRQSLQPSFNSSVPPLDSSLQRITASLAATVLQLSEKAGTLLQSAGLPMHGHSFAIKAFVATSTAAAIGTVIVVLGLLRRTGRLEAALAASQAHAQYLSVHTLKELETRLSQASSRHSASKARLARAAKQQRRLSKQHASLRKAHRRAERQKTTLQQKAVQLRQLLTAIVSLGSSMQQTQHSMAAQIGQVKAELARVERQMQALHKEGEAAEKIRADFGEKLGGAAAGANSVKKTLKQVKDDGAGPSVEEAERENAAVVAPEGDEEAGSQDMSQVIKPAFSASQASPRIGTGRLSHDHRGDYFSESFSLLENPFSPSFSGSVTTSFGYGMDHCFVDKGVAKKPLRDGRANLRGGSMRVSMLATSTAPQPTNAESGVQEASFKRTTQLVRADSKIGKLLKRFTRDSMTSLRK
ncbi:hypothetical protein ABBQ38_012199 [Trebouxia sp. C0009 RCD-2024]